MVEADKERIPDLSATMTLTDAYLILQTAKDLVRLLLLVLDFVWDSRKEEKYEFHEYMTELWTTLRDIQAKHRIDATLLGLIRKPDITRTEGQGHEELEQGPQDAGANISLSLLFLRIIKLT